MCAVLLILHLNISAKYAGELYISQAGHLEFTFSACADKALHMAFNAPIGNLLDSSAVPLLLLDLSWLTLR